MQHCTLSLLLYNIFYIQIPLLNNQINCPLFAKYYEYHIHCHCWIVDSYPFYWADVVSYPRHPEVTPSPWHTGLPQANWKLPQGPNPIGTLVPRHRWFGKQSS